MYISKSNIAKIATVSVSNPNPLLDEQVVVDGDFSSTYSTTITGGFIDINLEFASPKTIDYVAVTGNASKKNALRVIKNDDASLFHAPSLYRDEGRVMVFSLFATGVEKITVRIAGSGTLYLPEIAAGELWEVPNGGEQSGYLRPWSVPNKKSRQASSLSQSPISMTTEAREIKTKLSVPNFDMDDVGDYYNFIEHVLGGNFYVIEDDNFYHAYVGFNANVSPIKAHPQTRRLGVVDMEFNAFSRDSE